MTSYAVVDQRLPRNVTMTLDRELYLQLAAVAKTVNLPLSVYCREILKRHLDQIKKAPSGRAE